MAVKKMTAIRRAQLQAKKRKESLLEAVDEAITEIEDAMAPYESLNEQKQELLSSRRALLGGNRTTGSGGTRVRLEDVIDYVRNNPGADPHVAAEKLGASYAAVYAHLSRARGTRFLRKDGKWWLREPKKGVTEESDIEEENDE